ncbi:choline dehydrogenase, mitochondrial isoform X3 [Lampetra planeri]
MEGRALYWPRGRVLGGSSSLNAMVYIRGHALDYDTWEHDHGARGWSYAHCLPYFRRAQSHALGADPYRGGDGPLHVSRATPGDPLHEAFLEAAAQAGHHITGDMNGYRQEGFGWMDRTIHQGKRWSTACAYLHPALSRPNLEVRHRASATRVLFEGDRAVGVELLRAGVMERVYAEREVILCGGAINSPQLLLLSGIGPEKELKRLGIPVLVNSPGVGLNLQDHLEVYVQRRCLQPVTLYGLLRPHRTISAGLQWLLRFTGPCATAHMDTGGFARSEPSVAHPDVQFHFLPAQVIDHGRVDPTMEAFQAHVGSLRPTSVGWLKLRSTNPTDPPVIQPNYLSTGEQVPSHDARVAMRAQQRLSHPLQYHTRWRCASQTQAAVVPRCNKGLFHCVCLRCPLLGSLHLPHTALAQSLPAWQLDSCRRSRSLSPLRCSSAAGSLVQSSGCSHCSSTAAPRSSLARSPLADGAESHRVAISPLSTLRPAWPHSLSIPKLSSRLFRFSPLRPYPSLSRDLTPPPVTSYPRGRLRPHYKGKERCYCVV